MDRLLVRDKKKHNYSNYVLDGLGLTFKDYTDEDEEVNYMTGWNITATSGKTYKGNNVYDLVEALHSIKKEYDLKTYSNCKKDILVIYTDRIWELYCYLHNYISDEFVLYFQILDNIEFRQCWEKDIVTSEEIANWSKLYQETVFIPDKYFYITPSQIFRKRIKKACKDNNITLGHDIYPDTYFNCEYIRKALFGGVCYCAYPNKVIDKPVIEIDLKSAYIYCFLKPHCCTAYEYVDPSTWELYLNNPCYLSIGTYEITYTSWSSKVKCFKNINEEHCIPTEDGVPYTDTFVLNSLDLNLFLNTVNVTGVKCTNLMEYKLDYLPREILELIIEAYRNKEQSTGEKKAVNKVILNAIYGNTIRRVDTRDDWKDNYKNSVLAPQWGILITSYCKELIHSLGSTLDGWLYSDTDSIFCLDTPDNREKIKAFNEKTREVVKHICCLYGFDYEELKELGTFVIEEEIIKFKAWKQKQYIFTRKEAKYDKKKKQWIKMIKKAAGCNRDVEFDESLYEDGKEIPIGEKVLGKHYIDEPHSIEIDGVRYDAETSYYIEKNIYKDTGEVMDNETTLTLMEFNYLITGYLPY